MAIDRRMRIPAIFTLLFLLQISPCQANELTTSLGVAPSYFSGNYGRTTTTDIFYLPFHLKIKSGDAAFKITVPYIRVRSQGAVLAGGAVVGTTGGQATTRSGLGDIWLKGSYRLHLTRETSLTPYIKVKLGTASRAQGLGTGQNDYEFGGGLQTRMTKRLFPFVWLGYRIMGQPAGLNLNNIFTYRAGASYVVDRSNIATLMFYGHQSTQPGFAAAAALIGAWNYKASQAVGMQLFGLLGLSNGSPDYGAGVSLNLYF